MARLLKLAGLNTELTPHSLRHTHTSIFAEAEVSLPQIMKRLGHEDESTTKNVYLHITKEMKKKRLPKSSKNSWKTSDFKPLFKNMLPVCYP
ncbi:tyrosine-type recombinase/integrase [Alteribacillus bidgolensis]|uniref:tyrosine-type recombinase/integrase n=1 Tax=Alteribacillus bidgolensis TaxID=930129 RepID=UPI001FE9470F|nr:tyrosine-type recombinase/integrase [Alteribacillus bidgolensis]